MAPKPLKSLDDVLGRRGRAQAGASAVQEQQERRAFVRSFADAVAAQSDPEAAPAPTEVTLSVRDLADGGAVLRIPAGRSAVLRVTGIGGWHHDSATLRLAPFGRTMALPLTLERSTPGPSGFHAALSLAPGPPLFIGALIYGYASGYGSAGKGAAARSSADVLELDMGGTTKTLAMGPPPRRSKAPSVKQAFIGGSVGKLTLLQRADQARSPLITAILPNRAEGLAIAQHDDRVLHSVPRSLGPGDAAQSRDLSGYLNAQAGAGQDAAVFRLAARSDCCVRVTLEMARRRVSAGVLGGALGKALTLTPWRAEVLSPALPEGNDVTCTLTARARPSGPARLGLLRADTPLSACQRVTLPPRVAYLQPFVLPGPGTGSGSGSGSAPRRLAGLWLCLPAPPETPQTLLVDIAAHDSHTAEPGLPLASGKAEISARRMDLVEIGGGLLAHWVALDRPLDLDTPDLGRTFALVLRDVSGPVPLLEAPAGPAPALLLPALFRDFARSDRWLQRRFGQAEKVLMFEIGETRSGAVLRVQAGGVLRSVDVPEGGAPVRVQVPGAPQLVLTADRALVLKNPELLSRSAPSG